MINYPTKGDQIVFREPFPRKEVFGKRYKYYIRADSCHGTDKEIRIAGLQQIQIINQLIEQDGKLTGACVLCPEDGLFVIIRHSTQKDFFGMIDNVTIN